MASVLAHRAHFDVRIAGVAVRIVGSSDIVDIASKMLAAASTRLPLSERPVEVRVRVDDGVWHICGDAPASKKVIRAGTLPAVAGAVVSSVLAEVRQATGMCIGRATVVERAGDALIMVGDDWESSIILAAHLHTRGWRYLGGDYACIAPASLRVSGVRKSLHITSRSLPALPIRYRRAVEASPWYSAAGEIAFYAVDPSLVVGHPAWAETARTRAVVRVDGHVASSPALEALGGDFAIVEGLMQRDLAATGIEMALLMRGSFIETANLLDRWFAALPVEPT